MALYFQTKVCLWINIDNGPTHVRHYWFGTIFNTPIFGVVLRQSHFVVIAHCFSAQRLAIQTCCVLQSFSRTWSAPVPKDSSPQMKGVQVSCPKEMFSSYGQYTACVCRYLLGILRQTQRMTGYIIEGLSLHLVDCGNVTDAVWILWTENVHQTLSIHCVIG